LILSDVYQGRKMEGVERGEIKKLLILETLPKPLNYGGGMHDFIPITHGGTFTLERILGSVPVEQDGSAHFEVPANRPLFFIAVNEKNESVKRMHSFLSVMPGEVLSCVGCHEERMKTPLTSATSLQAMKRPANKIKPVPGVPYMIDFPRDIQPILDKHCVKCHSPKQPDGKIILTGDLGPIFSHSYFTLTTAGYVSDGRNRHGNTSIRGVGDSASQLMKMLDGSHYKAKLSPAEVEMIRNWIHVGASYPGTYAALGTGMVRLNALPKEHHAAYEAAKKAAEKAFDKSCMHCHKNQMPRAGKHSISGTTKPESLSWNSHTAFNLTSPENSRLLLAPLAKSAGGWGLCQAKDEGQKKFEGELFRDRNDEEYRALLAYVKAAKDTLDENKRWCMPGYKPHPYYVREMKRYGILPESFDIDRDKIDVFEVDRRYWESAWYYPKGDGPKLHKNEKMKKMLIFPEKGVQWEKDLTATVKE